MRVFPSTAELEATMAMVVNEKVFLQSTSSNTTITTSWQPSELLLFELWPLKEVRSDLQLLLWPSNQSSNLTSVDLLRRMCSSESTPYYSFDVFLTHHPCRLLCRWIPSLALWGGAAAGGVALFMSQVPIFQNDVLKKIPGLDTYYKGELVC